MALINSGETKEKEKLKWEIVKKSILKKEQKENAKRNKRKNKRKKKARREWIKKRKTKEKCCGSGIRRVANGRTNPFGQLWPITFLVMDR